MNILFLVTNTLILCVNKGV